MTDISDFTEEFSNLVKISFQDVVGVICFMQKQGMTLFFNAILLLG